MQLPVTLLLDNKLAAIRLYSKLDWLSPKSRVLSIFSQLLGHLSAHHCDIFNQLL